MKFPRFLDLFGMLSRLMFLIFVLPRTDARFISNTFTRRIPIPRDRKHVITKVRVYANRVTLYTLSLSL